MISKSVLALLLRLFAFVLFFNFFVTGFSQNLSSQRVRGIVVNDLSQNPVEGAAVTIISEDTVQLSTSDEGGNFFFNIAYGRYLLTVSKSKYYPYSQEVLVISGKESVLIITLKESATALDSVYVYAPRVHIAGQQQVTIAKSLRIPANFFDPVRMMTSFPGVVATNDQNNSIIVRGNSPNGLLWRLNGLDIVNPNHLANAGTFSDKPLANGGGVNILSAQVLDNTNFYSGTLPANYGNLLSGAIEMSFRKGNNTRHEFTTQASLIGLDVAAEGPLNNKQSSSYLVNYRYSTIGLLSQMGVKFGDETINFQDLSFNLNLVTKKKNNFSILGFTGISKNIFEAKDSIDRKEDKDWYDIQYKATTLGIGIIYNGVISNKFNVSYGLGYSATEQDRISYFNLLNTRYGKDNFFSRQQIASSFFRFTGKVPNGSVTVGVNATYQVDTLYDRSSRLFYIFNPCLSCESTQLQTGERKSLLLQPYWNWQTFLSPKLIADIGLRLVYISDTDYLATEPRTVISYLLNDKSSLELSYGLTSQRQLLPIALSSGKKLSPTVMNRFSLGYERNWNSTWSLRSEIYYQNLSNIPVDTASTFSMFNFLNEDIPANLINKGKARNYGLDITLEKLFSRHHYFLSGLSVYQSTYTDGKNMTRNSRFNGGYTTTITYGREWSKKLKSKTLGINTRLLYLGGMREAPVNLSASQVQYETVYDYSNGYSERLNDYVRLDFRISWVRNKSRYTRTLAFDIQNLLNMENQAYHYYDFTQNKRLLKKQLGIIPILVYRIDF